MCTKYADKIGKKEYLVYQQSAKCISILIFTACVQLMLNVKQELKTVYEIKTIVF